MVVVQQRYKVDNIFLKKNLEEKDILLRIQKDKIKELEDQNRELEQYNEEDRGEGMPRTLKMGVEESLRRFEEMKEKKQEIEISIISEETGYKHKILDRSIVDALSAKALEEIENEQMEMS